MMRLRRAIQYLTPALMILILIVGAACGSRAAAPSPTAQPNIGDASTPTVQQFTPSPTVTQPILATDPTPLTQSPEPTDAPTPTVSRPTLVPELTPSTNPAEMVSLPPTGTADLADIAFRNLTDLLDLGPRQSATDQERMAAEYLASRFDELGYSVMLQPFTIERISADLSGLTLEEPGPEEVAVIPLDGSLVGGVSGDLVYKGKSGL